MKYIAIKTYSDGDQAISNPLEAGGSLPWGVREGETIEYYELDPSRLKKVVFEFVVKEV